MKNSGPTVYVIQAPRQTSNGVGVDLTSANDFGQIEFILPSYAQPSLDPEGAMRDLRRAFENFGPEDYVASVGGDPAAIFLAGLVLPEFFSGEIRWLRWERRRDVKGNRDGTGYYLPTKIPYFEEEDAA